MSKEVWAFIGGIFTAALSATIFGWLTNYFGTRGRNLATKHDIEFLQKQLQESTAITKSIERTYSRGDYIWRSELDYRERQLSELYGPAYGYIKTQREIYRLWIDRKMTDVNLDVKKLLSKYNQILRDLIINKAHLIDGSVMPESFVRFFTSTVVFDLYAAPADAGSVPKHFEQEPMTRYPSDFDDHIIETAERLKARIDCLHAKYASPLT
jgi:hypothetical protein